MKQNVFISHCSDNAWLLAKLQTLIKSVNPDVDMFCSSNADMISPGDNYKNAIYRHLKKADIFVAVISTEYWKSKYCIFEMGAAYERHCFDTERNVLIQPLLLPPLSKGMAFANTPLVEIQVSDLTDSAAIAGFLRHFEDPMKPSVIPKLNVAIADFCSFVHRTVLQQLSLTKDAEADVFFLEDQSRSVLKDQVVRCLKSKEDLYEFRFSLSAAANDLNRNGFFASLGLLYWDYVNLKQYLIFDSDAYFHARIDNQNNVLNRIDLEFKPKEGRHYVYKAELHAGINEVKIPLAPMNHQQFEEVEQICFVIHPNEMNAYDGMIMFDEIRIDFSEKNILENQSGNN